MRTEGLAQTSRDPLSVPGLLTMPMRLHLNCAVYTQLSSAAPHQPPSRFLQTPGWLGSTLHAHCPCCNCRGCPPNQAPLCLSPRLLTLFFQALSLPKIIKAGLCLLHISPSNQWQGRSWHAHLAHCDPRGHVNVPPPLRPQLPLADPLADPLSSKIIGSPESPCLWKPSLSRASPLGAFFALTLEYKGSVGHSGSSVGHPGTQGLGHAHNISPAVQVPDAGWGSKKSKRHAHTWHGVGKKSPSQSLQPTELC